MASGQGSVSCCWCCRSCPCCARGTYWYCRRSSGSAQGLAKALAATVLLLAIIETAFLWSTQHLIHPFPVGLSKGNIVPMSQALPFRSSKVPGVARYVENYKHDFPLDLLLGKYFKENFEDPGAQMLLWPPLFQHTVHIGGRGSRAEAARVQKQSVHPVWLKVSISW